MIYICCVGFAALDVVCDELNDCAWYLGFVAVFLISVCMFYCVECFCSYRVVQ